MSDALTDAVRRLKALREDVERLKAEQNEEGEVRLFFPSEDIATVSDAVDVRGPGVTEEETATASDTERVYGADLDEGATWNTSSWNTSTYE